MTMTDHAGTDHQFKVCTNCEQWKEEQPYGSGHYDCFNECTKRGFEPAEQQAGR
jgi:hypothetical protein